MYKRQVFPKCVSNFVCAGIVVCECDVFTGFCAVGFMCFISVMLVMSGNQARIYGAQNPAMWGGGRTPGGPQAMLEQNLNTALVNINQ